MRPVLSKIRLLRIGAGLNQLDLAEKAGVHQSRLSLIETGRAKPTPEERHKLNKILHCFQEDDDE